MNKIKKLIKERQKGKCRMKDKRRNNEEYTNKRKAMKTMKMITKKKLKSKQFKLYCRQIKLMS